MGRGGLTLIVFVCVQDVWFPTIRQKISRGIGCEYKTKYRYLQQHLFHTVVSDFRTAVLY